MIKIAFVKFGGMSIGGTEKYLQTIASHLPKDQFEVDFYYTTLFFKIHLLPSCFHKFVGLA